MHSKENIRKLRIARIWWHHICQFLLNKKKRSRTLFLIKQHRLNGKKNTSKHIYRLIDICWKYITTREQQFSKTINVVCSIYLYFYFLHSDNHWNTFPHFHEFLKVNSQQWFDWKIDSNEFSKFKLLRMCLCLSLCVSLFVRIVHTIPNQQVLTDIVYEIEQILDLKKKKNIWYICRVELK